MAIPTRIRARVMVGTTLASLLAGAFVPLAAAAAPTANLSLVGSSTRVSLAGDNEWSLSKTGSLSGDTVTWNITATKTATVSGQLLVQGQMTVMNTGSGPATIGNIVVNLQKRQGNSWVTKSSDIANATLGDAADSAFIHKAASSENKGFFEENDASGSLQFMDATNNTLFSLVPQVLIGAGQTRTLLFSASFDNNHALLKLTPGTPIRAEVIVTFGNATQSGNSTANVDINGNGTLDADEARIRSVPSRLTLQVPAAIAGNSTPTLTDTIDSITKSGTVTITGTTFNVGATSGTVTATVAGGADGGTITNCARLTSSDQNATSGGFTFSLTTGLDLLSCSTVTVPATTTTPPSCTVPGTPGCPWQANNMHTWSQGGYASFTAAAGPLLASNFDTIYPIALVIGNRFEARFQSASDIFDFLAAGGTASALTENLLNPTTTSAGVFAGHVTALTINVDFSDAGLLASTTPLRDLLICNYLPAVNGMSVGAFLDAANTLVGGATATTLSHGGASLLASQINSAFLNGTPSTFAQNNLRVGSCTAN